MATRRGIRHRLVTIVLLAVVTSALSLTALVRVLSLTTAQRMERARDAVRLELDRLAAAPAGAPATTMVGMRSGFLDGELPADLPAEWRAPLADARRAAASGEAMREQPIGSTTTLLVAVRPLGARAAWAGYLVQPSKYVRVWQTIVVLLALATALLVATALNAVFTVKRGATALNASLVGLAHDLATPVPRPNIRELGDVADGIARLAQDLARSREMEERLGRELAQKERLAALGRVVAGVAHEVRNPLASIKLHLDLTTAKTPLPEPAARAVAHASEEIARLDRLVADLLVVAGRQMGPLREGSLGALVRARADALAAWAAGRQVTIVVEGEARAPMDGESMARAVDNLLRNAVEASAPGARVWARVVDGPDAVRVWVEDRGGGIDPRRAGELFEPFFTTKPDGTGLGLAISRAIARAHGGELTYARRDDVTRFELTLGRAS